MNPSFLALLRTQAYFKKQTPATRKGFRKTMRQEGFSRGCIEVLCYISDRIFKDSDNVQKFLSTSSAEDEESSDYQLYEECIIMLEEFQAWAQDSFTTYNDHCMQWYDEHENEPLPEYLETAYSHYRTALGHRNNAYEHMNVGEWQDAMDDLARGFVALRAMDDAMDQ